MFKVRQPQEAARRGAVEVLVLVSWVLPVTVAGPAVFLAGRVVVFVGGV